jgi:SAM-dependent methyltransferase
MLSPTECFLTQFHDAKPGVTWTAFGNLPVSMGERRFASSYEVLAAVVPQTHPALRVLDLACGDGALLALLAARVRPGLSLAGADFSAAELRAARARVGSQETLVQARAQELPLTDASVDIVLCHMALMLMDDAAAVLREIHRVLRPGGKLAAVVSARMPRTPALTCFLDILTSHARAPQWLDVRFGDRRFGSPEGIAELLAPCFTEIHIEELHASQRLTPDALWAAFLDMYDLHLVDEAAREAIRGDYLAAIEPHRAADGTLELGKTLRFIRATRRLGHAIKEE